MNIAQIFYILRARRKIIAVTFLLTVITTTVVSLFMSRSYQATASVVLNYKGLDPVTGTVVPGQLVPGYMPTQIDIIKSRHVALKVVDDLKMAENENVKAKFLEQTEGRGDLRQWLAELLLSKLSVNPSRDSSVIEITFQGSDPDFVALVANAFANAYQETNVELKVEPAQKAASYFSGQIKALREDLIRAQTRLSRYQQEKGFTSADERLDVETNRLNALAEQLVAAQSQSIESSSRSRNSVRNGKDSPDIAANPVIQNLKVALSTADSKLAEMSSRLAPNHPQYKAALAERNKIRSQLQEEIQSVTGSVGGAAEINQQREAELREQVAKQKALVLELNRMRDTYNVLQKDVETAQRALDAVTQRFSQTNLEAQANQSDVSVLNTAVAPIFPAGPRLLLKILFSALLGGILGIAFAILAELIDRRVRNREDVAALLDVPVLAVINAKPVRKSPLLLPGPMNKMLPSA